MSGGTRISVLCVTESCSGRRYPWEESAHVWIHKQRVYVSFSMNAVNAAAVALQTLRGEIVDIVLGTIFLFMGVTACAIAAIRWGRGVRILVWWGILSGM